MTFFPRGPGPLVSVIMPTRGRPGPLMAAVDSVLSLAKDPGRVEFLFKADDDDVPTIQTLERFRANFPQFPTHVTVSPRGNGYHDIHLWDNELATHAKGDWLFVFNDDAVIKTEQWDDVLMHLGTRQPWPGICDVALVLFPTVDRPFAQEFFCLRRKTYEIMGHMFLSPHGDNWLHGICKFLGVVLTAGVLVEHHSEKIGDKTREESEAAYATAITTLTSVPARWDQMADAARLLTHMGKCQAKMQWGLLPTLAGWYYWRDPRHPDLLRAVVVNEKGMSVSFGPDGQAEPEMTPMDRGGEWSPLRGLQ